MGGMRLTPKDVHREVLSRRESNLDGTEAEPDWYAIWLGEPHADGSVQLGRTERLDRPRWWRAYPAGGEYPRAIRGWTNIITWFLELYQAREQTTDYCTAVESERVEKWG